MVIAQAQGILMERYEIDSFAAFAVLRRASTNMAVTLFEVALSLVETRRLPHTITQPAGPAD
jgi:AmiR/NasT family two-component response regulator